MRLSSIFSWTTLGSLFLAANLLAQAGPGGGPRRGGHMEEATRVLMGARKRVVLIGHGSGQGADSRLSVPGPDPSAVQKQDSSACVQATVTTVVACIRALKNLSL